MTATHPRSNGWLNRWNAYPLYLRIVFAMIVGLITGLLLGNSASILEIPAKVILQLLGALAPAVILIAVTHILMTTEVTGVMARRIAGLLILNTLVAILIGLGVANLLRPGSWAKLELPEDAPASVSRSEPVPTSTAGAPATKDEKKKPEATEVKLSPVSLVLDNLPKSILGPLGDKQNVIGVICIAIAFGVALRGLKDRPIRNVQDFVQLAYDAILIVLHWIIQWVPLGVFAIVAQVIGTKGFAPFMALGFFILAVILALLLQTCWYLLRIKFSSWVKPFDVIRGMRDALVMAFSTGSSTATMPVTYACLKEKVGIREESASLGALVGANFNNDGTALYEAMAALFISQMLGLDLSIYKQCLVILTAVVASVGAAGIPEAGLVTMTLVFTAVGLPPKYIALLLPVDWFLDRCRTTINVLGDVNVSCLLDGKQKPVAEPASETAAATVLN